jgi:hypothetical protein
VATGSVARPAKPRAAGDTTSRRDPLQTGVDLLPLSAAVFFVAMGASRLSTRVSPGS